MIEDLALDVRMVFPELSNLSVLLGNKLLAHRRDLDVQVLVREVEVRGEVRRRFAVLIEFYAKGSQLVLPPQTVEVEEPCKLLLAVVGERNVVGRGLEVDGQV